jgi:hypothetical protein
VGFDEYEYRPTVGVAGGLWSGGVPFGLPTDQRVDEVYSLNYTTEPLEEDLEIFGWPQVALHLSSTAPVMAFVARLCDVAPDGRSALVCTGALNGTRRRSLERPEAMVPGEVYALNFELDATAWRFARGHRIRLSICSADFPNLWPTPYRGKNRVYRSAKQPSRLVLPLVPLRPAQGGGLPANELQFEGGKEAAPYALAPNEPVWQIVHDLLGDRTGLKTVQRGVARVSPTTEVKSERLLELWASNSDPADVVAVGQHLRGIVRQDGVTRVDACCTLKSTETAFHLTIELNIAVNGMLHFQRRWTRSFSRELL